MCYMSERRYDRLTAAQLITLYEEGDPPVIGDPPRQPDPPYLSTIDRLEARREALGDPMESLKNHRLSDHAWNEPHCQAFERDPDLDPEFGPRMTISEEIYREMFPGAFEDDDRVRRYDPEACRDPYYSFEAIWRLMRAPEDLDSN
jgi:hypothetical protein